MGGEYHFCHMFEDDGSIDGGHSSSGPFPAAPENRCDMTDQRKLSTAQRDVLDSANVTWVGWDQKGRPVVTAHYHGGVIQPADPERRDPRSRLRQWTITRRGDAIHVTYPRRHDRHRENRPAHPEGVAPPVRDGRRNPGAGPNRQGRRRGRQD
jgi:hypothetical protein